MCDPRKSQRCLPHDGCQRLIQVDKGYSSGTFSQPYINVGSLSTDRKPPPPPPPLPLLFRCQMRVTPFLVFHLKYVRNVPIDSPLIIRVMIRLLYAALAPFAPFIVGL